MNQYKDISVIIPCYNSADTLERAIKSILGQTRQPKEILIIDDASTDKTKEVLEPYRKYITLIKHEVNRGAAAARNTGIEAAKGSLVAFLDADDAWRPKKIEEHVQFMEETNAHISCSSFVIHRDSIARKYLLEPQKDPLLFILDGCSISPGSTLIAKKTVFQKFGLFPDHLLRLEDWAWLIKVIYQGVKISFFSRVLTDVYTTSFPAFKNVFESLYGLKSYIVKNNIKLTVNQKRHLKAAYFFELSAAYKRDKKVVKMVYYLIAALLINPKLSFRALSCIKRL